jgi:arsenate reductase-like glutaredoxin family protein
MNIQIFGTKKSGDTRKAERFFKERGIRFQFVDVTCSHHFRFRLEVGASCSTASAG